MMTYKNNLIGEVDRVFKLITDNLTDLERYIDDILYEKGVSSAVRDIIRYRIDDLIADISTGKKWYE